MKIWFSDFKRNTVRQVNYNASEIGMYSEVYDEEGNEIDFDRTHYNNERTAWLRVLSNAMEEVDCAHDVLYKVEDNLRSILNDSKAKIVLAKEIENSKVLKHIRDYR